MSLQDDPGVMALRGSLDAMDNEEKNSTLMGLLKQAEKKDRGYGSISKCVNGI